MFTADFSPTVAQLEPDLQQSGCACRAEELTQSSARGSLTGDITSAPRTQPGQFHVSPFSLWVPVPRLISDRSCKGSGSARGRSV